MLRLAFTLAAITLAMIALARTISVNLPVSATTQKYCRADTRPVAIDVPVTFRINSLGELVGAASVTIPEVVCNDAALLSVHSLGHGARSTTTSGTEIRYIATARFGSAVASVDTATTGKSGSTAGPQSGNITVTASAIEPATSARIPGAVYVDMLRIELTPK